MGFGVGAGKCHKVVREELLYLNLLLDGKRTCKWYLPLTKNEAGVKRPCQTRSAEETRATYIRVCPLAFILALDKFWLISFSL